MFRTALLICIATSTVAPYTAVAATETDGHIGETPKIVLSLGTEDTEEPDIEDGGLEITESPPEDEAEFEDLDFINRGMRSKNFLRFGRSAAARSSSSSNKEGQTIRFSRGEPDDNFIRLGRSANFVRLGRADADASSNTPVTRSAGSNFIRLGRGKDNNFIRLGRGKDNNFIRLGRGKDNNFIRLGRGKDSNFIRLGRGKDSNFIRLGRDHEGSSEDESNEVPEASDSLPRLSRGGGAGSNFIRLGRGGFSGSNFVRLGRRDNFLRLGRGGADSNFIRLGKAENFLRLGRSGSATNAARFESGKKSDPLYFGRGKLADRNFIRLGRSDPLAPAGEHSFDNTLSLEGESWKPEPAARGLNKRAVDNKLVRFGREVELVEDDAQQSHNNNNRSKRSTETGEDLVHDDEYDNDDRSSMEKIPFRYYYPLSAGVPNYVFAPELAVLPPLHSKRGSGGTGNGNFIRFG